MNPHLLMCLISGTRVSGVSSGANMERAEGDTNWIFFFLTVQRRGKTLPHLIHCIGEQLQNCISAITLLSGES